MGDKTTLESAPEAPPVPEESFAELLDESLGAFPKFEGTVVKGKVVRIQNEMALIDVGLKVEGWVALKEFAAPGQPSEVIEGDEVEVFVDRLENRHGDAVLSREKARREEAWTQLEKAFEKNERVDGVIFGRVKGGFTVDINGAVAFLPGSQVDIRPVRDIGPFIGTQQPFQILKMDRRRGNIVVSRRAVLEDSRAEERKDLISSLEEGKVLEGMVKNITDYGAFVDLGGIDGLLHVTDISWRRVNHPSEVLSVGQTVNVQVIRFNAETQRISLGMKQLEADPWEGIEAKCPVGVKLKGRVTNITDYGAFVELEPGVEGLVHVSEMSWTKKNVPPGKIVSTSQEVEVMVLDVDPQKRRISLGLKQCLPNPWEAFAESHPVGSEIEGEIKNITEFGLFVELPGEIYGMIHLSDLDWTRPGEQAIADYKKGDIVKAKVLNIEMEKERIGLGVKQLKGDPFEESVEKLKRGATATCTVKEVADAGIEVSVGEGAVGFIRKSDLARDRSEQRPDRFAVGDKLDAKITAIDRNTRRLTLSIKALEIAEEKKAMADFGSADSGASLGDILGAALTKAGRTKPGADATADEPALPQEAPPEEKAEAAPAVKEADASPAAPSEEDAPKKASAAKKKSAAKKEGAPKKASGAKKESAAKKKPATKAASKPKEAEASSGESSETEDKPAEDV
jgi:small subunit ribosomal protein S1